MVEQPRRFLSVDFLRGLSVAGMIIANNPGDTMFIYQELIHARWHGWTLVDFVFPLFLFLVGVSVALAVPGPGAEARAGMWAKALRRAGLLFALGLFLNAFPLFRLDTLRIPGVLQRIAVVYLAVLALHRRLGDRGVIALVAAILVGYWLLWAFVPVPGLGRPSLDVEYNLESWLDQIMMRGHIWEYDTTWDPEGSLSTLPAVALACIGVLAGRWLRDPDGASTGSVFFAGLTLHLAGLAWNAWFPINKMITTSSFVVFVAGVAVMLLAVLHALLDGRPQRLWMRPVLALGGNALFIYVVSEVLTKCLYAIRVPLGAGWGRSLHYWLYHSLFAALENRYEASLAWAACLLVLLAIPAMILQARRIRIGL